MAWIKVIQEDEAQGLVREVYQRANRHFGGAAEITKVFGLRPDLLAARVAFGNTMTFGGSDLGRYHEELIAVSISAVLQCRF